MDVSPEYVKMRLAATPDLGMGTPPELIPNTVITWVTQFVFVDRLGNFYYSDVVQACQLERQDQLQEMYAAPSDIYKLLYDFDDWIEQGEQDSLQCKSMEQLWLSFVMKERFGKTWSGTEWIPV